MQLTMRPTGLGHGFSILVGGREIGRIYERRGFAPDVQFFWALHGG